ncbi:DNA gyrase inhibitor YacG [uncultured Enterovirga sp.]|uniref:DNA gyrase inhibitor YacG n=1 Tax=uncultured Enterovirga sp. TaxID=2026352 RepID=UPI0035CBD749
MATRADSALGTTAPDTCPVCGLRTLERVKPFCSARCADVDLGRWLTGAYAIPVPDDEDEDDEGS